MKKIISTFSFITVLVVLFAFVFIGKPVETHAQVIECPVGYTCTTAASSSPTSSGGNIGSCSTHKWSRNLDIGSRGPDVIALQIWLLSHGFNIPSVSSGATAKGYFGSQTATALAQFQTTIPLPAYGFFGATTIAYLNVHQCDSIVIDSNHAGISASLDSSSPISSIVQISQSAQTTSVPLAVFDVRSSGVNSTLQSFNLSINYKAATTSIYSLFNQIQIKSGGLSYSGVISVDPSTGLAIVTFNNMNIPLAANSYIPITVYATVAQNYGGFLDGSTATVSLLTDSIKAIYVNYSNVPIVNKQAVSGSTITFSSSDVQISNTTVVLGSLIANQGNTQQSQTVTFGFSLTAGNYPIFLSKSKDIVSFGGNITPTIVNIYGTDSMADGSNYFIIAPGQTKSFTMIGVYSNLGLSGSNFMSQINSINYGTSTNNLSVISLTSGLNNLIVFPQIIGYSSGTSTSAQPPVIYGGTFPTTLKVGQTGTWTVNASDPQSGSLSYSVDWGDTQVVCPAGYTCAAVASTPTQSSSFTHSYSSAGNYTVTFTIKNSAGLTAVTKTTVNVTANTTTFCPAGYICTQYGQATNCPSGYTCSRVTYNCPPGFSCYNYSQTPTPVSYPVITYPTTTSAPTPTPVVSTPVSSASYVPTAPKPAPSSSSSYVDKTSQTANVSQTSAWQSFWHFFGL